IASPRAAAGTWILSYPLVASEITIARFVCPLAFFRYSPIYCDDVGRAATFADSHDVLGHGLHDFLVFISVSVPIVDIGNAAFLVIGHSVHRIATEPERGELGAERAAQVVRRHLLSHAEPGADVTHVPLHPANTRYQHVRQQLVDRFGQPDAVRLRVLGAGPPRPRIRSARHLPPPVVDHMFTTQMGNLAWPLTGEQDHLQWDTEVGPEGGNFGVAEDALTADRVVPLHAGARIGSNDLLPHGPTENRAGRGEHLVGQDGRCDGRDGGLDVRSPDAADVEFAPPWQQVRAN